MTVANVALSHSQLGDDGNWGKPRGPVFPEVFRRGLVKGRLNVVGKRGMGEVRIEVDWNEGSCDRDSGTRTYG